MRDRGGGRYALVGAFVLAALATLSSPAWAATITILNLDSSGEGLNDPSTRDTVGGNTGTTLGEQRLLVIEEAAKRWGARLSSDVEITIGVDFSPLECSALQAVLGSAGPEVTASNFSGAPRADTIYSVALANSLAGLDLCPESSCPTYWDIGATFNSSLDDNEDCLAWTSWYYGFDGNDSGGGNVHFDVDLLSVALHEFGHGLGFLSYVNLADGSKLAGLDDAYMVLLEDHSSGLTFPDMSDSERLVAMTDTGDLHWTGSAVFSEADSLTAGLDPSEHVEMYAPYPSEPGSSVSHFSTTLAPDQLMEPVATDQHGLDMTAALLGDTGWTTVECGDYDGSGSILAADALSVLKGAVGLIECVISVCDASADGSLTAADALLVLKAAVGLTGDLDCG